MKQRFCKTLILLVVFIITGSFFVQAQYFSIGNDPSGIKWKKISNDKISIIYPDYYEERVKRLAQSSTRIIPAASSSLFIEPYHIKTVIHPETVISNGWTMWVPRKVELSPMPSLYPMAESYSDHLLIHEFRHIAQLDKMNQGLTKVLGWFLGDQASASIQAIHVADWVSEGDAVLTETLLSHSGRGRNPEFSQGLRALLLDSCIYKYDKARFGSYKDFVPNHYVLGYHMVSMARLLDQDNFWSEMMDNVAKQPYKISNFNLFLRKRTGLWQGDLFNKTKEFLYDYWKENDIALGRSQINMILEDSSYYVNYLKPYNESDSSWICLKKSYENIPSIVRISNEGEEERILFTGSIIGDSYSYSDGTIVWAQQIADPRWEMRSFSDLFLYDISSKKKTRISRKQRYLYPVISEEKDRIACIEEKVGGSCHLHVLDLEGNILHSTAAPDGKSFRQPVWDSSSQVIYALLSGRGGKELVAWDIVKNEIRLLYDFDYKEIASLTLLDNKLIFTAPIGIKQGLYSFDLDNLQMHQIISSKSDLGYPVSNNNVLGLSVFTPYGYRPASIIPETDSWKKVDIVEDLDEVFIKQIKRTELEKPVDYEGTDTSGFIISEYKKYDHLFNFHSWAPVFLDPDDFLIRPGAMIMSQNDLNTLESSFGVQHNKQHKSLDVFADLTYTGLYPDIGMNITGGKRISDSLKLDSRTLYNVSYTDISTSASVKLPLFFSTGAYYQLIQPYFSLAHHRSYDGMSENLPVGPGNQFDLSYAVATVGLAGQVLRRKSLRDLYPRWGFVGGIQAEAGIANPEVQALKRYSGYLKFYLPGLLKHHSLRTYVGYSIQDELGISQLPFVSLPRGHYVPTNYDYSSYKVDYAFPFAYPDWAISSILYIKRFKANLFTDLLYSEAIEDNMRLKTGIDLTSNFYFLRINAEIDAGVRIIFDPLKKDWDFEFLYSFDF